MPTSGFWSCCVFAWVLLGIASERGLAALPPGYHSASEMHAAMRELEATHPGICQLVVYGSSYSKLTAQGGHDLLAARITNRSTPGPKPVFFLGANLHGLEASTAEIAFLFLKWLIGAYENHPDVRYLVDTQEIWVTPLLNPDGREAELWTNAREVNLERNFPSLDGSPVTGGDNNPGPAPFSEPESRALRDLLLSLFPHAPREVQEREGVFIELHSNGRMSLWPWTSTLEAPPDEASYVRMGAKFSSYDGYHHAAQYSHILPAITGSLDDWVYNHFGIPTFMREVLDPDMPLAPPYEFIEEEFWQHTVDAMLYAAKLSRRPFQSVHAPEADDVRVEVQRNGEAAVSAVIRHADRSARLLMTSAEAYLDIPPWQTNAQPWPLPIVASGSNPGPEHQVRGTIPLAGLVANAKHLIFVRGQDAAGGWGPVSAAFLDLTSNQPPVIDLVSPATECRIRAFDSQTLTVTAHDPEHRRLSCRWTVDGHPVVSREQPQLTYTPDGTDIGPHRIEVAVSDGGRTTYHAWTIRVETHPDIEIVDNLTPSRAVGLGCWGLGEAWRPWQRGYHYADRSLCSDSELNVFRWVPEVPRDGWYDVFLWWVHGEQRATNAPGQIIHAEGTALFFLNQRDPALGGRWNSLGTYAFRTNETAIVEVSDLYGPISADAVKLVRRAPGEEAPTAVPVQPVLRVLENMPASFAVELGGLGPFDCQWSRKDTAIPGATADSFTIVRARAADAGFYTVTVTNVAGRTTSLPIELRVLPAGSLTLQAQREAATGRVWLALRNPVPETVLLESSRDLREWSEVLTHSDVTQPLRWLLPQTEAENHQFYRVVLR